MTIVQRAIITHPDGKREMLSLFRVEPTVFRWIDHGKPWDGIDFIEANMAIKSLRMTIESNPSYVGYDLTFYAVEPPPAERASLRIGELPAGLTLPIDSVARIIQEETGIDNLIESINLLLTYEFPRRLQPKPPGLDLTWGGLCLSVIEALEVAQKSNLGNLKAELSKGIEKIHAYSNMPNRGGKPQ
jgi:hypothetical protein